MIRILLILLLGVLILPIFSIVGLSLSHSNTPFEWYHSILANSNFREALALSLLLAFIVGITSTCFAFILGLSWFNKKQRFVIGVLVAIIGLLPPDVFALSLVKVFQVLKLYDSHFVLLLIGMSMYTLPFSILLFWSSFYFINNALLMSAEDIGLTKINTAVKIILPISKNAVISSFILSSLLAFNEYPRTFYLSGSRVFLSEFLNGKLSSGADKSIYAGGSLTILVTSAIVCLFALTNILRARRQRIANLS
jgi:ABC-type spermidine/putrescine transport system permease subunit II